MYFVENLEITHAVGGVLGGGSCCLRHYDPLCTKIDVTHPLYLNTFETIEKVEPDNYD